MLLVSLLTAFTGGVCSAVPYHAETSGSAVRESAPLPGGPDTERAILAQRLLDTFLSSGYLQVNARILHEGKELLVRSDMTADKLRVEAFRDNALIAAFAINGDRVQEYRPLLIPSEDDFEYRNVIVEFDKLDIVESAVSVGSAIFLDPETGCEFGTLMTSWLDPRIDLLSTWSDRILEGAQLEDQTIEGVRCLVFHDFVTMPANEERGELTIKNTLYINPETSLPVRWDTSQSTSAYSIERERTYEFVRAAEAPEGISWTLDVKQLQNAAPPRNSSTVTARSEP